MSGRTIFPGTVRPARSSDRWALKRGEHSRKIGDEILKSKWKGFPVWTLTLEERATCPRTCQHWRSCYGNKISLAARNRESLTRRSSVIRRNADVRSGRASEAALELFCLSGLSIFCFCFNFLEF
jgi:hypothetical protein